MLQNAAKCGKLQQNSANCSKLAIICGMGLSYGGSNTPPLQLKIIVGPKWGHWPPSPTKKNKFSGFFLGKSKHTFLLHPSFKNTPVENWLFYQDGFLHIHALWIGTSNINTPTVTSQIPHFLRSICAQCRCIWVCKME